MRMLNGSLCGSVPDRVPSSPKIRRCSITHLVPLFLLDVHLRREKEVDIVHQLFCEHLWRHASLSRICCPSASQWALTFVITTLRTLINMFCLRLHHTFYLRCKTRSERSGVRHAVDCNVKPGTRFMVADFVVFQSQHDHVNDASNAVLQIHVRKAIENEPSTYSMTRSWVSLAVSPTSALAEFCPDT